MLEYVLKLLEENIVNYENKLYFILNQIKNSKNFEESELYFEKIGLIKAFLDDIYLSFNEDLKIIMNQRIGKKNKLFNILKDFDRIDDIETRKYLTKEIKKGVYD